MSENTPNTSYPTPPAVPQVSRETGEVNMNRPENGGKLDGWESSTNPWEGGVSGTRFSDAEDFVEPEERKKRVAEFNQKSSQSII